MRFPVPTAQWSSILKCFRNIVTKKINIRRIFLTFDRLNIIFQPPNVGKELTGGCQGFATEFMQWAEELVVGGTEKDNNGTLIR